MGNGIIDRITDEVWGKKSSVCVILAILLILGGTITSTVYSQMSVIESNTVRTLTQEGVAVLIMLWVSLLILFIWYLVYVYRCNHIRGAQRGKTGIVIYYDCESKGIYQNTVRRLGEEFRDRIQDNFDIIDIPYGVKKPKIYDERTIVDFLNKRKSILYINIIVNSNEEGGVAYYDMHIDGAIIHPKYNDSVEKEFQKVLTRVLNDFRDTMFSSKDMIMKMRITAKEMSIGCEYIIGLSCFLNGQLRLSENICEILAEKLQVSGIMPRILLSVNRLRYEINMVYACMHLEKYQFSCDVQDELIKMNEYLEKANTCMRNTFEYYLNKAYYYLAFEENVQKAKECINICKQKKNAPLIWKYSDAFLKAFENRSIGSVLAAYKSALKIPYNTIDLTVFIESMVEKKPKRIGLYLALGILYKDNDDPILASENFEKYISYSEHPKDVISILHNKEIYDAKSLNVIEN